ncbi:MAG: hypothetical protein M1825_000653 [Sarcosagium campestre]|nr:MAG: hypothetical protein M1825_000653 [Sarcosagium campestre]
MAQEYASTQPQGFQNRINKIAIVGAGGQVGKFITEELLKVGKQEITAITRKGSETVIPAGVTTKQVDYDDPESLKAALEGQDALVITMSVMAPKDQETKLIEAAAAANVAWILPNEFGYDVTHPGLYKDTLLGAQKAAYRDQIEKLGKSSWIGVTCGFWYEFSLSGGPERYGFDLDKRSVTFFDEGSTRINTSTWPQCGRAVANLLNLKVLPDDEDDKSASLLHYRNKFVYISSFNLSQRDMLDSVLRVTGTTEKDWKIDHEGCEERYKAGVAQLQTGDRRGFAKLMYTRVFFPDGSGDYETSKGLQNDVLGLPKEDLDEYTKIALQTVQTVQYA